MSHILSHITIKNFRSCKDAEFDLTEYTPMVGYNNAGKSNILQAVEWIFKDKLLSSDFYNDQDQSIEVEGLIEGVTQDVIDRLDEEHREPIRPYIVDNRIKIKRVQIANATKKADMKLYIEHPENGFRPNPRGISNAIKALFPDPIKIGAMENAAEDSSKAKTSTTIGKLLSELCDAIKSNHEELFNRHLNAISRRIGADGNKRVDTLDKIDSSINEKIENFFPGVSLKLHFNVPDFDDIFKAGTVKVYEDQHIGREFGEYGHGAQRSIQMALIQELAEVKKNTQGESTTLLLIDEPELYLHPFAIEQVREALFGLTKNGYQVIFSTHSAQMITSDKAQHTLLIRKSTEKGTHSRQRLQDALNVVIPDARAQSEHLFALSQSTDVLFSNRVILTEGKTELRLLPLIYKAINNATLGQKQLGLIETGSVDNIGKTMAVLNKMDLPCKAIVDLDYVFKGAIHNQLIAEDDKNIIALKSILAGMCETNEIVMKGDIPGAKHCAPLAQKDDATVFIENLHNKLKESNIWVWKKGAIEAHLGITAKNEHSWAMFKQNIDKNGVDNACSDSDEIRSMIEWLG
ncbi:AAA family ATPase [Ferrimonas senticii]|uniref:AAA family ATPase n=1 Tax=Ferrimonas senticii TaxID=394566 RepID=UPI00042A521A|nr:AAA family ATPase [Ferrimonas senticii]